MYWIWIRKYKYRIQFLISIYRNNQYCRNLLSTRRSNQLPRNFFRIFRKILPSSIPLFKTPEFRWEFERSVKFMLTRRYRSHTSQNRDSTRANRATNSENSFPSFQDVAPAGFSLSHPRLSTRSMRVLCSRNSFDKRQELRKKRKEIDKDVCLWHMIEWAWKCKNY